MSGFQGQMQGYQPPPNPFFQPAQQQMPQFQMPAFQMPQPNAQAARFGGMPAIPSNPFAGASMVDSVQQFQQQAAAKKAAESASLSQLIQGGYWGGSEAGQVGGA